MNKREYIEKYILPYEDSTTVISYQVGDVGYDLDYVKEHAKNNNIIIDSDEEK